MIAWRTATSSLAPARSAGSGPGSGDRPTSSMPHPVVRAISIGQPGADAAGAAGDDDDRAGTEVAVFADPRLDPGVGVERPGDGRQRPAPAASRPTSVGGPSTSQLGEEVVRHLVGAGRGIDVDEARLDHRQLAGEGADDALDAGGHRGRAEAAAHLAAVAEVAALARDHDHPGRAGLGCGPQPFELGDDCGGHVGGAEVGCGRIGGHRQRGQVDQRVDPGSHGVGRLGGTRPPRRRAALGQEVVQPVADRRGRRRPPPRTCRPGRGTRPASGRSTTAGT